MKDLANNLINSYIAKSVAEGSLDTAKAFADFKIELSRLIETEQKTEKTTAQKSDTGKPDFVVKDHIHIQCFANYPTSPSTSPAVQLRYEKLQKIKDVFNLSSVGIYISRSTLYRKAAEVSGLSIDHIKDQGGRSYAETLISSSITSDSLGKGQSRQGVVGVCDEIIDKTFKSICLDVISGKYKKDIISQHTVITSCPKAISHQTFKGWLKRRGLEELFSRTHPNTTGRAKTGILSSWVASNPQWVAGLR